MKRAILVVAILGAALSLHAQNSYTITPDSPCGPSNGQLLCLPGIVSQLVDEVGGFYILFPANQSPSNQGEFTVVQNTAITYTPKVTWGYAFGLYTVTWQTPTGQTVLLDFRRVNSARFGQMWVIESGRVIGKGM